MYKNIYLLGGKQVSKIKYQVFNRPFLLNSKLLSHHFQQLRSISTNPLVNSESLKLEEKDNDLDSLLILSPEEQSNLSDKDNDFSSRYMAVLHACLKIGEIERAYNMLAQFRRKYNKGFKAHVDINVHNAFMSACVDVKPTPDLKRAMEYFSKLESSYGVKRNISTYAIIIKGHIRANKLYLMKVFYKEMKALGYTLDSLKGSPHLSDSDLDIFFNAIGHKDEAQNISIPSENLVMGDESLNNQDNDVEKSYKSNLLTTKVHGVKLLKNSLETSFSKNLSLHEVQMKLEETAMESALEKIMHERDARGDNLLKLNLTPLRKLMSQWKDRLTRVIDSEQKRLKGDSVNGDLNRSQYAAIMCAIKPEKLAILTIQATLRSYGSNDNNQGSHVIVLVASIAKQLEQEYHSEQMVKKGNRFIFKQQQDVKKLYASGKLFSMALRKARAKVERENISSDWVPVWSPTVKIKFGSFLLSALIESATFTLPDSDTEFPAFSHTHQHIRGTKKGVILCDPYIKELLIKEPSPSAFGARLLPMLVLPKPWLTYNSGAYYTSRQRCMRSRDAFEQTVYLKKSDQNGMLTKALTSLDVLGSVRWRVNKSVLEIVKEVWNSGKAFAGIPPGYTEVVYPNKPEDTSDVSAMIEYRKKCNAMDVTARNNHSLRCDVNYKVEIANAFQDYEFYFPHNLDFRGRAYPIPPLFNHLGNDLCRGLLTFSDAKRLGERGLFWLKVQLASLTGYDKASFADRVKFTDERMEQVKDSAENPLDGKQWWLEAEDPWQCLATCIELNNAMKLENPEDYLCGLPIHQDGTCNGLQHYAALGLDVEGAMQVNLQDSDKPQDVYSGVLKLVLEKINKDAEDGLYEATKLKGHVTRKVIKQTVMTNVYGVTFIGANLQIHSQLKHNAELAEEANKLSYYLTTLVFASLGELFSAAQAIQAWLNECAGRIATSIPADILEGKAGDTDKKKKKTVNPEIIRSKQMTSVIWTTPLGITIVQPYRKGVQKDIRTNLQTILIHDTNTVTPVNSRKQRTAFPPNFIHSLDASHMMLTSIKMAEEQLSFASVHDSYWTHACDVDKMNVHIREQFIELHKKPILQNLIEEFQFRFKGYKRRVMVDKEEEKVDKDENEFELKPEIVELDEVASSDDKESTFKANKNKKVIWVDLEFPSLPQRGKFELEKVRDATYFFH
ncbi:DNA/RNA polymerase [Neoconidiobolus thromboides FSU 785]|nr:DNA/RNA polymerase [Neoconidiobolus thromboides FSU 785]